MCSTYKGNVNYQEHNTQSTFKDKNILYSRSFGKKLVLHDHVYYKEILLFSGLI